MHAEALRAAPHASASVRDIMGIPVVAATTADAVALLGDRILRREFTRVAFINAHVSNVANRRPAFKALLAGFIVLPDGLGVDIASQAIYGQRFPANLNGTDFVPDFLVRMKVPLTVGLLGARPNVVARAAARLGELAPQHHVRVVADGYFGTDGAERIRASLVADRPDVLLVALGVPKQEEWIDANLDLRHCTVAMGVGALFDFVAGEVPRAPDWIRTLRSEWIFRLWLEPGRLWRRYIVGNPVFLASLAADRIGAAIGASRRPSTGDR